MSDTNGRMSQLCWSEDENEFESGDDAGGTGSSEESPDGSRKASEGPRAESSVGASPLERRRPRRRSGTQMKRETPDSADFGSDESSSQPSREMSDLDRYNIFAFPERGQAVKREAGSSPERVRKQARQSMRARHNDFSKNMRLTDMLRPGKARRGRDSSALDKIAALEDAIKTEGIDWDELDELEDSIARARESRKTHATSAANAVREAKKAVYERFDNDWVNADLAWEYVEPRTGPAAAHRLRKEFHTLDFGSVARENPHRDAVLQAAKDSWPLGFYEMVRDDGALYTVHALKRFLLRDDYADYLRRLPDVWTQWALHQMLVTDDAALQDLYFDLVVRMREIADPPTDLYFWALEGMHEAGYCGRAKSAQVLDFIPTARPPACILRALRLILDHAVENYKFPSSIGGLYTGQDCDEDNGDSGLVRRFARHISTLACDAQIESSGAIVCEPALAKLLSCSLHRHGVATGLVEGIPRDAADPDYVNEKARFRLLGLARRAVAFAKNDVTRLNLGYVELQLAYSFLDEYAGDEYNPETRAAQLPNELISRALYAISDLVTHKDVVFATYAFTPDGCKPPLPLSKTTDLEARRHLLLYAVHSALLLLPHVVEHLDIHGAINGVPTSADAVESPFLCGEPRRKIYDALEHFRGTVNPTVDTLAFYHALTFACKILRASITQHRALV